MFIPNIASPPLPPFCRIIVRCLPEATPLPRQPPEISRSRTLFFSSSGSGGIPTKRYEIPFPPNFHQFSSPIFFPPLIAMLHFLLPKTSFPFMGRGKRRMERVIAQAATQKQLKRMNSVIFRSRNTRTGRQQRHVFQLSFFHNFFPPGECKSSNAAQQQTDTANKQTK